MQAKRSEVLFVDYMAEHLTSQGRAAIIVPEGIIFKGDSAYKQLRKMLVDEKFLVGVISLPAGLFNPYSGVKTSILWLDKTLAKKTDKIMFVKIENDGFDLGAQRRPIKKNDLPDAYQAIMEYKERLLEGKNFGCERWRNISLVAKSKVAERGEYNLSGERYRIVSLKPRHHPVVSFGASVQTGSAVTKSSNQFTIDGATYPGVYDLEGFISIFNLAVGDEVEVQWYDDDTWDLSMNGIFIPILDSIC